MFGDVKGIFYLCTRKTKGVLLILRDGAVGSSLGS